MKKILISLFVIVSTVVTISSCVKDDATATVSRTIEFFANAIDTKTSFDTPVSENGVTTYPTLWTVGDKVDVFCNYTNNKTCDLIVSDDCRIASFRSTIDITEATTYKFYSVCPASAASYPNTNYTSITVEIPTSQSPTLSSVDPNAQVLAAVSQSFETVPSSVSFLYEHITAYGRMSLTNLPADANVSSVKLQFSKKVVGKWYYYPDHYSVKDEVAITWKENDSESAITLNTSSTQDIWFACVPADFTEGGSMMITVSTDKGAFVRDVDFTGRKFEAGKVAKFAVNMEGVTPDVSKTFTLVQNAADLTVGSEIIIAAKDYDFAMGIPPADNYMTHAAVVKSDDKSSISNIGASVMVLTLAEGSKENTFAMLTPDGKYLCAVSSSDNHLRTGASLTDNGSWKLAVTNGVTSVVAQGSYTKNAICYYTSDQYECRFSCYASVSTQKPIAIYKAYAENETPSAAVETVLDPVIDTSEENLVKITCASDGATIYYTTDGTVPSTSSIKYSDPITITEGGFTLKAIAVKDGCISSAVVEKTCEYTSAEAATPYEYVIASKTFTQDGNIALNGLTWNITSTTYSNYTSAKGQQLGTSTKPNKSLLIYTDSYTEPVSQVKVNTSGANNIVATLEVYVGGVKLGETATLTNTSSEYTFSVGSGNPLTGKIELKWTQTSSVALYLKSIKINKN